MCWCTNVCPEHITGRSGQYRHLHGALSPHDLQTALQPVAISFLDMSAADGASQPHGVAQISSGGRAAAACMHLSR